MMFNWFEGKSLTLDRPEALDHRTGARQTCDLGCVGLFGEQLLFSIGFNVFFPGAGCRLGYAPINMRNIGGAYVQMRGHLSPSVWLHPAYCRLGCLWHLVGRLSVASAAGQWGYFGMQCSTGVVTWISTSGRVP